MKRKYFSCITLLILLSACQSNTDFDATGTFEATEIIVSAESNGRLFRLDAEEGMRLSQGEEIGLIDTVQLYLKKLQLEANMKAVNNQRPDIHKQIAATKEQLTTAHRERERVEKLLKANAANRKQLDDWEAQISVLQSQLEAQISSLTNNTQSLNEQSTSVAVQILQIEDLLSKCHILSPIDGTVLAKYAEPGELASTGKPLFKIADTHNLFLRAYVTTSQLKTIKLGAQAKVLPTSGTVIEKNIKAP